MDQRTPARHRRPPARPRRSLAARLVRTLLLGGFAVFALGVLALLAAVMLTAQSLPSFREMMKSPQGQSVVIRAADGTELVTVGPSFGRWLAYDEIPPHMVDAMIAVEDRRFHWHPGVDPVGTARAFLANLRAGRTVQGGSTITQQLARNLFLTNRQTWDRKLREAILALAIERRFTKRAIMELYLNRVYFGGGAYGIDAASRKFFGHSAQSLSLAEAAIIAGLVKAPSRYAPTADPERARARGATVVETMRDAGLLSAEQAAAADTAAVRFAIPRDQGDVRYFTDWVLAQLETLVDEASAPLEVTTTLVPAHQRAAEEAVHKALPPGTQGAIVAMRTTGEVTAMVGGRDYATSTYNRATIARRQPGSAFKLFVYLAAIENGLTPETPVLDAPITIGNWSPRNDNGRFLGTVTAREAFARSINTVAVRLANEAGFGTVAGMARRLGITTPVSREPAMALGASEVTLLELTAAYATVAAEGREVRPFGITAVSTADGRLLYRREEPPQRILLAPHVAAHMTALLRAAVETGTGRAAQIGRPLAGKTGTTSSNRDGWFVGFTPELVAGVWIGRDDAKAVPGLAGGRAPARAFAAFMGPALAGVPVGELNTAVEESLFGLEPDAEVYGLSEEQAPPAPPVAQPDPAPEPLTERWLEDALAAPSPGP
ncbi:transglycosylase domain-containing protein [Thermaurantiacus tibetensis]|uniref:transglycosylase domain-containing protein n=1 Tax=Thermaurantiacus tibetensis TaxID=2759035 RepID=UPI00188F7C34|nr:PBP1A family penicillin-binding protein [Thermaurantiacus tibetensis]